MVPFILAAKHIYWPVYSQNYSIIWKLEDGVIDLKHQRNNQIREFVNKINLLAARYLNRDYETKME